MSPSSPYRTSMRSCSFVGSPRLRPPPSHLWPPPRVSAPTAARRHLASNAPSPTQIIPMADAQQKQDGSSNDFRKKKSRLGHNPGVAGRQFLTHPGVPAGTMFAREEMAIKKRMIDTRESVQKHLAKRFGAADELLEEQGEDAQNRMERGRRTGVASLVEERIQLSMIRGEFANLKHKGKLERERTPGLDRTTDMFMDVLKRNGVLPEWIQRQKRVNSMTDLLRRRLEVEYARACMDANPQLELVQGDVPLARTPSLDSFTARVHRINSIAEDCAVINSEILTYNLQVPALHLQRLKLQLDPLIAEASLRLPSSYQEARQLYRSADREGLLGVTALMEHRLDFFSDDGSMYQGGGGTNITTYWQKKGGGGVGGGGRRKRDDAGQHITELMMIPIDSLSKALARLFSI